MFSLFMVVKKELSSCNSVFYFCMDIAQKKGRRHNCYKATAKEQMHQ